MANIFLSYAHEDKARAAALASALEGEGWTVFWDRTIPSGKTWRSFISDALHEAGCVVVAWTEASVTSDWVAEEADEGRERSILVPVLFEHVKPPLGFRNIQAEMLADWDGDPAASEFRKLVGDIEHILGPAPGTDRAGEQTAEIPATDPLVTAAPTPPPPSPQTGRPARNSKQNTSTTPADAGRGLPKWAIALLIALVPVIGLGIIVNTQREPAAPPPDTHVMNGLDLKDTVTTGENQAAMLLDRARKQASKGILLTTFSEVGAINLLQKVLEIDPGNKAALTGLQNLLANSAAELEALAQNDDAESTARRREHIRAIERICKTPAADRELTKSCQDSTLLNNMQKGSMDAIRNIRG